MGTVIKLSAFRNTRVYFDTNIFIYAVEQAEQQIPFFEVIEGLFLMAASGQLQSITSELSLAEVLVGAYKNNKELVVIYDELFTDRPDLEVYPVDKATLRIAAYIRSIVRVALADAIHVATALNSKAQYFITNDAGLNVPEGITKVMIADISLD